jgi:hypothetical protein
MGRGVERKEKRGGKWPGYPDGSRERETHTQSCDGIT